MAITDYGLEQIGSWFMGLDPSFIGSLAFGIDNSVVDTTLNYLGEEITRKAVTWSWNGNNPQANVSLLSTEANGSGIGEIGFVVGTSIGSDACSRDLSAIGSKDSYFNVEITADIRITRG